MELGEAADPQDGGSLAYIRHDVKGACGVSWSDDDRTLRSAQSAVNKIALRGTAAGFAGGSGSPSRVAIGLDGKEFAVRPELRESAAHLAGRLVAELTKGGYDAKVEQKVGVSYVHVVGKTAAADYSNMSYAELKGVVKTYAEGAAPLGSNKAGTWLELAKPIQIDGQSVSQIFVGDERLKDGASATLNGRLERAQSPLEIFPPKYYAQLTGMTNTGAGEPRFDGKDFFDQSGTKLNRGSYLRPDVMDIPSTIFVFDHAASNVFVGGMGGHIPQWMNSFHGLRGVSKMRAPTAADAGVRWKLANQTPTNAEGKALTKVGSEPMGIGEKSWFIDAGKGTLYAFVPTTRRGPDRAELAQVVKLPSNTAWL